MPANPRRTAQTEKPTFVFAGTIKQLKAATLKDLPINDRTAVVMIDQIIEAPSDLARYHGQEITVLLSGRRKVSVGQQMIFRATPWLYGESIAVRSVREEPIKDSKAATLRIDADPVQRRGQREQLEHFNDVDLVVSGKVLAVRLPGAMAKGARAAAENRSRRGARSEHDPKWREAVIQVDEVHKGEHKKKQVVVRFAASTDVMWYRAPKFHPGQQGYFMLHKTKVKTTRTRRARKLRGKGPKGQAASSGTDTRAAEAYAALDPSDFQPYGEPGGIRPLIELKSTEGHD